MEVYDKGKALISNGIIEDAKRQAEEILNDAEKQAEEKIRFAKKQAESIIKEAEQKAEAQISTLKKRYESFIELEKKKRKIKLRENVFNMVIDGVRKRLKSLIEKPEYRGILKNWMIEASVGLGEKEGIIRTSRDEHRIIDESLIKEVEGELKSKYGLKIKLQLDRENFLQNQGVMIFSKDGKKAFNNEVSTRILRKQRKIQQIIYDYLLDKI